MFNYYNLKKDNKKKKNDLFLVFYRSNILKYSLALFKKLRSLITLSNNMIFGRYNKTLFIIIRGGKVSV